MIHTVLELIFLVGTPVASVLFCWVMIRLRIEDAPDGDRKTQAAPVPSSGGIAILAAMSLAPAMAMMMSETAPTQSVGVLWGLTVLAGGIGLIDDVRGLSARLKMGLLLALALWFAGAGPQLTAFDLPWGGMVLPGWFALIGVAVWIFVMMNATNFMDGSNGLAVGSAAIMLAGMIRLMGDANEAALAGTAILACLGFLVWNLQGKLYAGDAGALSLGALIAGCGVVCAELKSVWASAIIVLPFLIDVFMTLIWRARRGRNLLEAHRDHAYQLFLRAGWPHFPVASLWWSMTAMCAAVAVIVPASLAFWAFIILLSVGTALWTVQRATLGERLTAEGR